MSKTEDKLEASMRVLKTATCKTLSGKSILTYQIGCTPDSIIHLRITKSTGGGFSDEWIAHDDIQHALKKRREKQAITSFLLIPLFKGKSANNSSFLLAALKHLKLVRPLPKKKREHEPMDPRHFLDQVDKLMSSPEKPVRKASAKKAVVAKTGENTSGSTTKKASVKKAAIKKRSASRLKKASTN